jgi:hypothetical protein
MCRSGRTRNIEFFNVNDAPDVITLILPDDLLAEATRCQKELDGILADISRLVQLGQKRDGVEEYKSRVYNLRETLLNTINLARWGVEKANAPVGRGPDLDANNITVQALVNSYSTYNTLLQTCNRYFDKGNLSGDFHDISLLIGGYKVKAADGRYGQEATLNYRHDYFDAFMAVAQTRFVAGRYGQVVGGLDQKSTNSHEGGRALLGTFEAEKSSLKQQLAVMAVIYRRMPTWQQDAYRKIIFGEFGIRQTLSR